MMKTRRHVLTTLSTAFVAASARSVASAPEFVGARHFPDPAIEVLDARFERYRAQLTAVERMATGFRWAEGPVWFGAWRTLVCSDVQNNRLIKWDEDSGASAIFRAPSNYSNGNTLDRQGRLLTCEGSTARITRTEHDGTITVLMDGFEGKPLNSPNDIVCRSDGSIWFTDPAFGPNLLEGTHAPLTAGRVYRLDPLSRRAIVVADDIKGPNGLLFSPDEKLFYLIESRAMPNRLIWVYDVVGNGTRIVNRRVFFDCGAGTADGFRADTDGNLWCGWGMGADLDGVIVLAPGDAKVIGRIRLPERCANLCFGGAKRNRLLMAATTSIYSLYVNVQGAV
jgi:gluconolactonase